MKNKHTMATSLSYEQGVVCTHQAEREICYKTGKKPKVPNILRKAKHTETPYFKKRLKFRKQPPYTKQITNNYLSK